MFPEIYSKPVLIDIVNAADLGWSAICPGGSAPTSNPFACDGGSQFAKNSSTFDIGGSSSGSGQSSGRLINPGDVGSGL